MKTKNKMFIMVIIIFIILVAILVGYNLLHKEGNLIELNYKQVMEKINNNESFVICITQTTCSHCSTYKPKLLTIAKDYNIDIFFTEVNLYNEEEKKEIKKYLNYSSTPTTLFIKDGEESTTSNRLTGDVSKDKIIKKLKSNSFID